MYQVAALATLAAALVIIGGGRALSDKVRTIGCRHVVLELFASEACIHAKGCTLDRMEWVEYITNVSKYWKCMEEGEYDEHLDTE